MDQKYDTNWIWTTEWTYEDDFNPKFVYFRKEIMLPDTPNSGRIDISADSRYKLYVNGEFVQEGPSKGDKEIWYYDEADLLSYLKTGKNVIAIEVLRYPEEKSKRNHSIHRGEIPGLYIVGNIRCNEQEVDVSGKGGWKCYKTEHIRLVAENVRPAPLHILEEAKGDERLHGWKLPDYDDGNWQNARPYSFFQVDSTVSPGNLVKRNIPYQKHTDRSFQKVVCVRETTREELTDEIKDKWETLLGGGEIIIPANMKETVEISAGELMTGYLLLHMAGGKDAKITIHCAECYSYPNNDENAVVRVPIKGDRKDYVHGRLHGFEDHYQVGGFGTDAQPETYEPFWFRTFRFVGVTVETEKEPLIIKGFSYRETGYPLEIKSHVATSDESLSSIWDISERTLRRCMHETYMDCPFYEQLQYAMDSRSQILFTYATAADDRLARKCMDDFRRSQRGDGFLNSCAPNCRTNVIPGFSIYYIFMVYDHMMYFGDRELVKLHFPAIDGVLDAFDRHISEQGLVQGMGGLIMRQKYWSFIDWVKEWYAGTPPAILKGPITMESLLYILGLEHAAKLAEFLGRECVAAQYKKRAKEIRNAIHKYCIGQNGLIQDGPGVDEYSVHCQVFGVLADVFSVEVGRKSLLETIGNDKYAQCSVAMSYYLFRALEKVGLYEKTKKLWDLWRDMVNKNLTTCVENSTDERSDCHAWGALVLYELPAVVLGVRPAEPGFKKVKIKPTPGYLTYAKGEVITPEGMVQVEWEKAENGEVLVSYQVPEGMEVV